MTVLINQTLFKQLLCRLIKRKIKEELTRRMSAQYLKALSSVAPGFLRDKDEEWLQYLESADQIQLRNEREKILRQIEVLDDLRDELKKKKSLDATTQDKIVNKTNLINSSVKVLLKKIPKLKERALEAREIAIRASHSHGSNKRKRLDNNDDLLSGSASIVHPRDFDFLPSHLLQTISRPVTVGKRSTTAQPTAEKAIARTTPKIRPPHQRETLEEFLKGIEPKYVELMKQLRPTIDKFDCKDRVLNALDCHDKHNTALSIIDWLQKIRVEKGKGRSRAVVVTVASQNN